MYYTKEHEWVAMKGDIATIGITDYAQNTLGELVYVELPSVGSEFKQGDNMGIVESVKAAGEIYAPVSGTVTEHNTNASDSPAIINTSPTSDGWLVRMRLSQPDELEGLMTAEQYADHSSSN